MIISDFIINLEKLIEPYDKVITDRAILNYMLLPVTKLELNHKNVQTVNTLIDYFQKNEAKIIKRSPSGGISISRKNFSYFSYDLRACGAGFELTIVSTYSLRIQLGSVSFDEFGNKTLSGTQALRRFKNELAKDGIDLNTYAIENGKEINETIHKPMIKSYIAESDINKAQWYENVHHLDFHSAYMSGLYASHPEFRNTISRLYFQRKKDEAIKSVFTNTIGKMHSEQINWKFANLSKDAINTFYEMFISTANKLAKAGRTILAYNTDGIWYQGDIYIDENTGPNLTQFSNDYINCRIRFKSDGAYQFYYNGQLYTKLRGKTRLDAIKPRDKNGIGWNEEDLYSASAAVIMFKIKNNKILELGE